jgi:hypothetical protein
MYIQTKLFALTAAQLEYAHCGFNRLVLAGFVIAGLAQPALALETGSPDKTTQADCQQAAMAVNQGIKSRLPANPEVVQAILNLKHQADKLCHNGSSQSGLAKLQQAAVLLESGTLPAKPLQQ